MTYHAHSTDEDLLQGCLAQDRRAQQYLYQRYFGKFLGIPLRYTGNREDAVEVLNAAFLRIFNSLPNYEAHGSFAGWMARIVFNTTIDHVRSRKLYRERTRFDAVPDEPIENDIVAHLDAEHLYAAVSKLPPATRAVFSLYVVEGYKHAEIAVMLDIGEGTSKWHLAEARRLLRQILINEHPKR